MSDDQAARLAALEQLDEDLFDFPDVEGMAELLAAARAVAAGGGPAAPSSKPNSGRTRSAAETQGEPKAPLPAPRTSAPQSAARSNGTRFDAAPRNAADLDDDLFGFGDVVEVGGGEALLEPSPRDERAKEAQSPRPALAKHAQETSAPVAKAPVAAERAQDKARAPKRKKSDTEPRASAERIAPVPTGPSPAPSTAPRDGELTAQTKRELTHSSLGGGSPFLAFPTSIDLPPARSKLLWVLVGCFLLANGGVFLMTQQQNQSVNQTLVAVTSTLAEAVARGSHSAPRDAQAYRDPVASGADPAHAAAPVLDSADFSSSNELGLHNARRLIEQGAYSEARRNLFFILANQDRSTPLTPALREDIDYLIALTYYDQGRSIAVEEQQ
jgi:hypothetical protein